MMIGTAAVPDSGLYLSPFISVRSPDPETENRILVPCAEGRCTVINSEHEVLLLLPDENAGSAEELGSLGILPEQVTKVLLFRRPAGFSGPASRFPNAEILLPAGEVPEESAGWTAVPADRDPAGLFPVIGEICSGVFLAEHPGDPFCRTVIAEDRPVRYFLPAPGTSPDSLAALIRNSPDSRVSF